MQAAQLERNYQQTRLELQTTREEMQTSHEELRSTNEEMQSTNEELQSTNEELTTSKEEMQSLNEELQTVNAELQSKVDELSRTNNDMKNLLNSTDIATLFLDNDLTVRRFTTEATKIINLIAGDIGRPITDLRSNLLYPRLATDARQVLRHLNVIEKPINAGRGRWFTVRIMPYRTLDERVEGVVITFADITVAKTLETQLREQQAVLEKRVAEQIREIGAGLMRHRIKVRSRKASDSGGDGGLRRPRRRPSARRTNAAGETAGGQRPRGRNSAPASNGSCMNCRCTRWNWRCRTWNCRKPGTAWRSCWRNIPTSTNSHRWAISRLMFRVLILEANLTGAALLGIERSRLINRPLVRFVVPASRSGFNAFFERIMAGTGKQVCEAALINENHGSLWASFHGTAAASAHPAGKFCRVAVSDITSLKQAEEAQRRMHALATANRHLRQEISRREAVETALKESKQHYGQLLEQSQRDAGTIAAAVPPASLGAGGRAQEDQPRTA